MAVDQWDSRHAILVSPSVIKWLLDLREWFVDMNLERDPAGIVPQLIERGRSTSSSRWSKLFVRRLVSTTHLGFTMRAEGLVV